VLLNIDAVSVLVLNKEPSLKKYKLLPLLHTAICIHVFTVKLTLLLSVDTLVPFVL